jgi:hypothetical protein
LVQAVAALHGGTLALDDNHPGLRAELSLPPPDSRRRPEVAQDVNITGSS